MILWFQQKVDIVETHETIIRSVSQEIPAPAVLKLRKYIRPRTNKKVQLSRENIFIRDNYCCQYCEKKLPYRDLTLDHVFPVSRGGGKSWESLVAACRECNNKKGNRTPKEANMKLLKKPVPMKWKPIFEVQIRLKDVDELWSPYIKASII